MPVYETQNRRPARLVRLDTLRLTVKADGSVDRDEHRRLMKDSFTALFPAADATDKGRENRWSPKISDHVYKNILLHLGIR